MEIYGDAVTSTEAGHLQLADGMPAAPDYGSGPRPEVGVKLDKGGVAPTAPQPPFGNQQGQTAKNVTGVPDCGGKLYNLYDYFNKTKGVVLPIMSPS